MIRVPGYELTIGNQRWTKQALELDVRLHCAPVPDALVVRFPSAAAFDASPGDDVALRLDGGDGAADVFAGDLDATERLLDATVAIAINAGGLLARTRPAVTVEQATSATVIRALCDEAGADVGSLDDGVQLAYYAADPTRTAWEHVARVAGWAGAIARVDPDGKVGSLVVQSGAADVALRYGRDVLVLERLDARRSVETFAVAGETGVGAADDADALRPATDFFAGNRPDGPGGGSAWTFEPALRTTGAARKAGDARASRYAAAGHRWRLDALLQPALRPGGIVEITHLPDGLTGGTFVVESVHHVVSSHDVRTRARLAEAGAGKAGGAGGLLAAVGGALGR
jgi:hypothetical protein